MNEPRLPNAERLTALLRLVAVPVLLIGEVYVPSREPTEGRFFVVLAVFDLTASRRVDAVRRDVEGLVKVFDDEGPFRITVIRFLARRIKVNRERVQDALA